MSFSLANQSERIIFIEFIDNQQQKYMTENIRNSSDQTMRYRSPRVKVIEVNVRSVLCLSEPSLTGWQWLELRRRRHGGRIAMRHAIRTLILAMAATLAVASCTEKEPENINRITENSKVYLKIGSVTTSELTKAAIEGTSFPTDEDVSIGIFVRETEGSGEYGYITYNWPYENVKCTRAAGQTEWVMSKDIELDETSVIIYAYYPWKEGTGNGHINVYPSVDGDDWMWGTPVENVSSASPDISLSMNHALALVELTFNVSNYSEGTEMTNLSVSSTGSAKYSNFNFKTGVHFPNGQMTDGNALSADINYPLESGVIKADCLLIPAKIGSAGEMRQPMTISCVLCGKTYTANLSGTNGVIIKQGVKSTVSLNIKGSTMEVTSVGIGEWSNGDTISETIE